MTRALNQAHVGYALCGGMAVVLHGYPRLTRDIDILIRPESLLDARKALEPVGFTLSPGLIPFDVDTPNERQVFRVSKPIGSDLLTVDFRLLPNSLGHVWANRETYDIDGVPVDTVSREGLVAMKRLAGRPQDLSDIANLQGGGE